MNRLLLILALVLGCSTGARASSLTPRLELDASVLDAAVAIAAFAGSTAYGADELGSFGREGASSLSVGEYVAARAPSTTLPPDYQWVERDTQAFWYATGVGAAATLATHVFVGLPCLVFGGGFVGAMIATTPVLALAFGLGALTTYFFLESFLSAAVAGLVFDGTSETYVSRFLPAVVAHFGGSIAASTVTALTFGGGALLLHGMGLLSGFTASGGITALALFSVLGAMPAVVIAGIATVAVPALVTSWAIAVTAGPKSGYAIDDGWLSPVARVDDPARSGRFAVAVAPVLALPLPSP